MASIDSYNYDLGKYKSSLTSHLCNKQCQVWFQRGLIWSYSFHHEEAVWCYEQGIKCNEKCLMAYWGISHALGPNYNDEDIDEERVERARKAVANGLAILQEDAGVDNLNQHVIIESLLRALQDRYSGDPIRMENKRNYITKMKELYNKFCSEDSENFDLDIACLYAEALMQMTPWKLWDKEEQGYKVTGEISRVLNLCMNKNPVHPGACHFFIHLMEMSSDPSLALAACASLRDEAVPCSGHLRHMPSHIDVLIGNYADAIVSNQKAVLADRQIIIRNKDEFYTLYRCHNHHFLVYAAMFAGKKILSLTAAQELTHLISDHNLQQMGDWFESFLPTSWHAQIRFGLWDEILETKIPQNDAEKNIVFPVSIATAYYARALARASLCDPQGARKEQNIFKKSLAEVPDSRMLFNNASKKTLQIAEKMLEGEILYREEEYEKAFTFLEESVTLYDNLDYDEPWGFLQPPRNALSALLLEQAKIKLANVDIDRGTAMLKYSQKVCEKDLKDHPNNVWSLAALLECLSVKRLYTISDDIENEYNIDILTQEFKRRQQLADIEITKSCFCSLK